MGTRSKHPGQLGSGHRLNGRKPYFPSQEAALRMLPGALRQYSMGRWVVREYPLDISALDDTGAPIPEPARPSAA